MARAKIRSAPGVKDAGSIHTEDYKKVKKMFTDLAKIMNSVDKEAEKATLVAQICEEFTFRGTFEDEIFYTAVRAASDDDHMKVRDEANAEHTVQSENSNHRVEDERAQIFPQVNKVKLGLVALGAPHMKRGRELRESLGTRAAKKTPRVA